MTREESRKEDRELVARIQSGDSEAENRLSAKYNERILLLARQRKLPISQDAEDVSQETMLAVLNAVRQGQIREPENVFSYISRVCSNKAVDILKRRKKEIPFDEATEEEILTSGTEDERITAEMKAALMAVWEKLSPLDRMIVYLKYIKGMKYKDMAKILGLSAQTLRKRAQRAIGKMRNGLKKDVTFSHFFRLTM